MQDDAPSGAVVEIASLKQFHDLVSSHTKVIINFWASWCGPAEQMNKVFAVLAKNFPTVSFLQVEAEKFSEIAIKYAVSAVPFFVFLLNGTVRDSLEGANPPELSKKVRIHSEAQPLPSTSTPPSSASKPAATDQLHTRLASLINYAPVMVFMKGTPDSPRCGFSRKMVEILQSEHVKFSSFDILTDNGVREGLKVYSNWPTFPQLYINGKLIGGLDILKELQEEGELATLFPKQEEKQDRFAALINQAPVMLFMKGNPETPRCGFSNRIVGLLNKHRIKFSSFDILSDEEVREGLKKYSNWPTYPQLYVKGKLLGGLDIVTEMSEEGELMDLIPEEARS